jgi:hypothetical protein
MECLPAHLKPNHVGKSISNSSSNENLNWLGLCDYDRALEIQSQCHDEVLSGGNEVILAFKYRNGVSPLRVEAWLHIPSNWRPCEG